MEIKKVVMKLNIHDDKDKQKAMKAVSSLTGINSVEVDMEGSKMIVIGEVDPVSIVSKLKKQWNAQIVKVGPAKEEEKDDQKDDIKDDDNTQIVKLLEAYNNAYKPALPTYYYYQIIDENPNSCVTT